MNTTRALTVAISVILSAPLCATLPSLTEEERREHADVIITGRVSKIYTDLQSNKARATMNFITEIAVGAVEKGMGVEQGQIVLAKSAYSMESDPDWVGDRGQMAPAEGSHIRAYLKRSNGEFHLLKPNGITWLDDRKATHEPPVIPLSGGAQGTGGRFSWAWALAAFVAGFGCGLSMTWLRGGSGDPAATDMAGP